MSADNHTKAPWYCEGDAIYDNPDCAGSPIAHVLSCAYGADDNAVDAVHIVACVNAMAAIPADNVLLSRVGSVREYIVAQEVKMQQLQRDVDAWKEAIKCGCETGGIPEGTALVAVPALLAAQRDQLLAALERIMQMDVNGHALQDRLQFSPAGRAILEQCQAAIAIAAVKGSTA